MYFLQIFNAFTSAGGSIAMRQMKNFHESVITWYSNWSIMLSSIFVIAVTGQGLGIYYTFSTHSWMLLFVNGFTATTFQMCRFKAFQLQNAAKLQLLTPVTTLIQFCADLILFHITYSNTQYLGIALLVSLNLTQAVEFLICQIRRRQLRQSKREAEKNHQSTGETPDVDQKTSESSQEKGIDAEPLM